MLLDSNILIDTKAKMADPVLKAKNICKQFGGNTLLKDLDLELFPGEVVLLKGQNGAGKTTLVNILSGYLKPDSGDIQIFLDEKDKKISFPMGFAEKISPFKQFGPEKFARMGISRTWQDVRLFKSLTIPENIAIADTQFGKSLWQNVVQNKKEKEIYFQLINDAKEKVNFFKLQEILNLDNNKLSLGQSKRIELLRVIHAGIKIIFFDEPLSGLDQFGIENVVRLLKELSSVHKISLVIIEHEVNSHHILDMADNVWHLKDGKIEVESARSQTKNSSRKFDLTHIIQPEAYGLEIRATHPLEKGAHLVVLGVKNKDSKEEIFSINNLAVKRNQKSIIGTQISDNWSDLLNISLKKGELAFLFAPNGWGKTTLLECLMGKIPPATGQILLHSKPINHLQTHQRVRAGIKYFQSNNYLFPTLTVGEYNDLRQFSALESNIEQTIGSLSGGQRQSLYLSNLLRFNDKDTLFILDEPFTALDSHHYKYFMEIITKKIYEEQSILIVMPNIL